MRKLITAIDNYGLAATPPAPPPDAFEFQDLHKDHFFYFPPIPVIDSAFDFATLSVIAAILLLSLLSISFIFHLRIKSRHSHHLQNFNILWTVRLLLVILVSLWSLNEITRLPFFRRRYLFPFLPPLSLAQQSDLCKLYVVLSLGFFEPGFLVSLLFLINVSVKQRKSHQIWSLSSVVFMCIPTLMLQIFFVFFRPLEGQLPLVMHRSSVLSLDAFGNKTVMCTYPLFSTIAFTAFAIVYSLGLLLSCWRVVSMVINKGIRVRINILGFTVMAALLMQTVFLAMSSFWTPENVAYSSDALAMFVSVVICAAVGEVILVIKPILEALAAGRDCCRWNPVVRLGRENESEERTGDRTVNSHEPKITVPY